MNREQMAEAIASLIVTRGKFDDTASAILDLILPQVSTVEELERLLVAVSESATPAVVVDSTGRSWTLFEDDRGDWYAQRLGDQDEALAVTMWLGEPWQFILPLPSTVVWQPAAVEL